MGYDRWTKLRLRAYPAIVSPEALAACAKYLLIVAHSSGCCLLMRFSFGRVSAPGSATRAGGGKDGIDAEDDDDDDDDEEDDDEEDDDGGEGVCSAVKLVMEEMIERGDETSDNEGNSPSRERRSRLPGTSCC